jgi:hypothetical protein
VKRGVHHRGTEVAEIEEVAKWSNETTKAEYEEI